MSDKLSSCRPKKSFEDHSWDEIICLGSKRERKDLRVVIPWFILNVDGPYILTQADLHQAYETKLAGMMHTLDQGALRYALNAFVVVINSILTTYFSRPALLTKIAGPAALQQRAKDAFRAQYSICLTSFVLARAVRGNKSNEVSPEDENGLFNCVTALKCSHISVGKLTDLIIAKNITIIMDWCDEHPQDSRTVQMMTVLAHLAGQANQDKTRSRVLAKARPLRIDPTLDEVKIRVLASYAGTNKFSLLIHSIKEILEQEQGFCVEMVRSPLCFISGTAILIAIFAPASLDTIHSARFKGVERAGVLGHRPTLALHDGHDNLEHPLPEGICRYIDLIYARYAEMGRRSESLFTDINGEVRGRPLVVSSIETLLEKLCPELTTHDLRDLGVAQALAAGDSFTTIARAARISERGLKSRFKSLSHIIQEIRRKP